MCGYWRRAIQGKSLKENNLGAQKVIRRLAPFFLNKFVYLWILGNYDIGTYVYTCNVTVTWKLPDGTIWVLNVNLFVLVSHNESPTVTSYLCFSLYFHEKHISV